ncbi:STAS domain-containing protein [Chloroflexus sp.]|uniref:STAS domain-containing protein n=1 Tax=Chloroflexus sp. TaxID=1904827 RepID=UPI002ACE68A8|nr:STAS domain-containing protein [Chloroflexus sp.]MCX7860205.1 STAS domain-containing protein [Chloroflexus sp.]
MPKVFADIVAFAEANLAAIAEAFVDRLRAQQPNYAAMDRATLLQAVTTSLKTLMHAISTDDLQPFLAHAHAVGEARAASGFIAADMFTALNELRHVAWDIVEAFDRERHVVTVRHVQRIEDIVQEFGKTLLTSFSAVYRAMQAQIHNQAEQIEAQQQTIRELSTPILPLYEGILVLPLVGAIDSFRAGQIMERLLTAIAERQSDIVIIDITGVPVIDTAVANYLLQTARAAQLIGAQVILVGIGPEIAQTIVQLGVDLSGIAIGANLQNGIELALRRIGRAIKPAA